MPADVTFIMPAFNAGDYIAEAIESILAQTVEDWKLIIVNDGSSDDTLDISERYAEKDNRIRVISQAASGSVYQPRKRGILEADTSIVSPLDADDWIEPEYLDKLLKRKNETGANIVYPVMYKYKNSENKFTPCLKDFSIYDLVYTGKECVKFTLDGWRINCNGGLIDKNLYEYCFDIYNSEVTYGFADELLTRQLLFNAPRVAFSLAKYFYRENEVSVTHAISPKLFEKLINTVELIKFTRENYGVDSEEYYLAHRENFLSYFDALVLKRKLKTHFKGNSYVLSLIRNAREAVEIPVIKNRISINLLAMFMGGDQVAYWGIALKDLIKRQFK